MEVTKNDVQKLIEIRKEDTFLNHLWTVFSRDMRPNGEINRNEIKVWRQDLWNSSFYPIFTFEFDANNNLTNITDQLNPIGKTFIGLILIGLILLIFPKNLSEFELIDKLHWVLFFTVFGFLIVWVARKSYRLGKQNQLEQIFEILDIEVEEKKNEKEWSLKNILIRMFTYPFCAFLIRLNITTIIPNGNYILSIITLFFIVPYFYTDLKLIFKKQKNYW